MQVAGVCVLLSSGCIQYKTVAFENSDIRNHPRISPRIFAIIRKFWGRVGCEKIDVRWGTSLHIFGTKEPSLLAKHGRTVLLVTLGIAISSHRPLGK